MLSDCRYRHNLPSRLRFPNWSVSYCGSSSGLQTLGDRSVSRHRRQFARLSVRFLAVTILERTRWLAVLAASSGATGFGRSDSRAAIDCRATVSALYDLSRYCDRRRTRGWNRCLLGGDRQSGRTKRSSTENESAIARGEAACTSSRGGGCVSGGLREVEGCVSGVEGVASAGRGCQRFGGGVRQRDRGDDRVSSGSPRPLLRGWSARRRG